MPWKRNYRKRARFRRRRYYGRRSAGTGRRSYRTGYNRFGRISSPELKSKTLTRDGVMAAATVQEFVVWPAIVQGMQDDQRIGNRINGKFLNIRLILSSRRPTDATLPQNPPVLRYVLWQSKDPTSNAAGALPNLTLVDFLNTKQIRILKTGYITLDLSGTARVKVLNTNLRNRTINFIANTDVSANTTQRIYLSVYTTQVVDWQMQSKFYFADP